MEHIYGVDKYSMINDTKKFDHPQFQCDNLRRLLTKLIYALNQGIGLSNKEQEMVFFRVTKLFYSNDPQIRRLIYKSIKMLGVQYVHIKLQSLQKDLMNSSQLVRVEALSFISIIEEEEHIIQIERFVQQAILDKNSYISSTALLVGIKIVNKFPNIVRKWQSEIQFQFNKSEINYHALILLYEMNKFDRIKADYLKFPNYPQLLVNFQILRFLKEISRESDKIDNLYQEMQHFLNQSILEGQNLIFLECYSFILQNRLQSYVYSYQIHQQFYQIFNPNYNNIEIQVKQLKNSDKLKLGNQMNTWKLVHSTLIHPYRVSQFFRVYNCKKNNQSLTYNIYLIKNKVKVSNIIFQKDYVNQLIYIQNAFNYISNFYN